MIQEQSARRERWETLSRLHGREKLDHLWTYYKAPIIAVLVLLYVIGYISWRAATHKDVELYIAFVNVSVGETAARQLTDDFISAQDLDPKKHEVSSYQGLTLSESDEVERQYVYAAEMKILAAINAKQLDVVIMDDMARDIFERNGYLLDIREMFNDATDFSSPFVFDISSSPYILLAGFSDAVYLGILANSPRMDNAADYVHYLMAQSS